MRLTGSTLSVFYLAVSLHIICALLIICILPESLTDAKARMAQLRYEAEKDTSLNHPILLRALKEATRFFNAPAVLLPGDAIGNMHKKDWNLLLLTICYGLNTSFHVSMDRG